MSSTPAVVRMSHRSYLRALSPHNRRAWAEQRARLTPRVPIGNAWVPHFISRQYAYVPV